MLFFISENICVLFWTFLSLYGIAPTPSVRQRPPKLHNLLSKHSPRSCRRSCGNRQQAHYISAILKKTVVVAKLTSENGEWQWLAGGCLGRRCSSSCCCRCCKTVDDWVLNDALATAARRTDYCGRGTIHVYGRQLQWLTLTASERAIECALRHIVPAVVTLLLFRRRNDDVQISATGDGFFVENNSRLPVLSDDAAYLRRRRTAKRYSYRYVVNILIISNLAFSLAPSVYF